MTTKRKLDTAQYEEFMARAYAMELEATERYAQLAEQLETHNNGETAALFRRLAAIEAMHGERILHEMGWPSVPLLPPAYAWDGEGPETAPLESAHYLMHPWHALEIALRCELQAQQYYEGIAAARGQPKNVREAARAMALDEADHVQQIRKWMAKVRPPDPGWDDDPDPPQMNE